MGVLAVGALVSSLSPPCLSSRAAVRRPAPTMSRQSPQQQPPATTQPVARPTRARASRSSSSRPLVACGRSRARSCASCWPAAPGRQSRPRRPKSTRSFTFCSATVDESTTHNSSDDPCRPPEAPTDERRECWSTHTADGQSHAHCALPSVSDVRLIALLTAASIVVSHAPLSNDLTNKSALCKTMRNYALEHGLSASELDYLPTTFVLRPGGQPTHLAALIRRARAEMR